MKTIIRILAFIVCAQWGLAQDNKTGEINRIAAMTAALDSGGIDGFLMQCSREAWRAPHIPSQWHVEHVAQPEDKPVYVAARAFGETLAKRLVKESVAMQQPSTGEPLYTATIRLLDLSEWCGAVDGYGNVFLAQRCLDLSAVGLARLAADLRFPLQKASGLLERMQPAWMSAEANLRILNQEAGVEIFTTPNREEMDRVWGTGATTRRHKANPKLTADMVSSGIVTKDWHPPQPSKAIEENLAFFDDAEAWQMRPPTLLNIWDKKVHQAFVVGFGLQNITKARALVEFRQRVGAFPEKVILTAEELRDRERGRAEAAKAGLKVTNMEDAYASPMAAAFAQAWRRYLESETSNIGNLPQQRQNLDAPAFQAYSEVQRGAFLDHDSAAEQQEKRPQSGKR